MEFVDYLWKLSAGWLGWTPDVFNRTSIPIIELAIEGAIDREITINPYLTQPGEVDVAGPKILDRDKVATDVKRMFDQMIRRPAVAKGK